MRKGKWIQRKYGGICIGLSIWITVLGGVSETGEDKAGEKRKGFFFKLHWEWNDPTHWQPGKSPARRHHPPEKHQNLQSLNLIEPLYPITTYRDTENGGNRFNYTLRSHQETNGGNPKDKQLNLFHRNKLHTKVERKSIN